MKQDKAIPSIGVQYVPYGINGEYFIYDNNDNCIPIGYGHIKGTKKFIQGKCDELNRLPSIGVKDGVIYAADIEDGINKDFGLCEKIAASYNGTYVKGYNPAAMEELYKALDACKTLLKAAKETLIYCGANKAGSAITQSEEGIQLAITALNNAKTK